MTRQPIFTSAVKYIHAWETVKNNLSKAQQMERQKTYRVRNSALHNTRCTCTCLLFLLFLLTTRGFFLAMFLMSCSRILSLSLSSWPTLEPSSNSDSSDSLPLPPSAEELELKKTERKAQKRNTKKTQRKNPPNKTKNEQKTSKKREKKMT